MKSTYKPEYCEEIIRYGKEGKNFKDFAKSLNIRYVMLYKWAKRHPEFKVALETSRNNHKIYNDTINKYDDIIPRANRRFRLDKKLDLNFSQAAPSEIEPQKMQLKKMSPYEKYKPEFCDDIIWHGRKGGTLSQFAANLKVNLRLIYTWAERHPEFKEAMEISKIWAQNYWLSRAKKEVVRKFNFGLWESVMVCEFGYKRVSGK